MKKTNLLKMVRGWFIGDFEPTVLKTKSCEVGIKTYLKGDREPKHFHKIATEITVILDGKAQMNGKIYKSGDIVTIEPGEGTDFEALEDTVNVVVKVPSVKGDKYLSL